MAIASLKMSTENPHLTALHTQRWRPTLVDGTGQRLNPRPTAHGPQTALVVGPEGETTPGSSGPVHCDALGRVRVRFHWQAENDSGACWIRVGQAFAGKGFGAQFLPRSGQEVLVHFVNSGIDRPIISKALYNGRGEGGVPPTPGGAPSESKLSVYENASDQRPSAPAPKPISPVATARPGTVAVQATICIAMRRRCPGSKPRALTAMAITNWCSTTVTSKAVCRWRPPKRIPSST